MRAEYKTTRVAVTFEPAVAGFVVVTWPSGRQSSYSQAAFDEFFEPLGL